MKGGTQLNNPLIIKERRKYVQHIMPQTYRLGYV